MAQQPPSSKTPATCTIFYFPYLKSIYFQINFSVSVFGVSSHTSPTKTSGPHCVCWLERPVKGGWSASVLAWLTCTTQTTVALPHRTAVRTEEVNIWGAAGVLPDAGKPTRSPFSLLFLPPSKTVSTSTCKELKNAQYPQSLSLSRNSI